MIVDVDDSIRAHVAVACRMLARQMRRDGFEPPAGLLALADEILRHAGDRDALTRQRALSAARSRSYRARQAEQRRAAANGEVA
jgi:hypothetical protein